MDARKKYLTERFMTCGMDGLLPTEALELLLTYVASEPEKLSRELIERFGGISNVLNAKFDELIAVPGVNHQTADLISSLREIYYLISSCGIPGERLDEPEFACRYFKKQFEYIPVEQFKIACLDSKNFAICCLTVASGTGAGVTVGIDDILKALENYDSRRIIIAHNHPAGSCQPSKSDEIATEELIKELTLHGIILLDHIICGRDGVFSMKIFKKIC